jgi:nucleotide-binding universal stress UspA family protein
MKFKKILVPVTGTPVDSEAMRLACQLGKKDKAKVRVVCVITIKRSLPLEAEIEPEIRKAEEILDRAEIVAEEEGYEAETDVLQAREAGPAIVDEAVERGADLILMGVPYKRRFGQFSLGTVVPYVLINAPCRIILYHERGT